MFDLFYRNPRLLLLTVALIVVSGLSSFYALPRMEDPTLTERVSLVTTRFPGADAARVESLVTEKLEEELQEIEEIKELRSQSRSGTSLLIIELRDDVYDVEPVWSRIRDKLDDARPVLPPDASKPHFDQMDMKAYAMIVALVWDKPGSQTLDVANYAILKRLAKQLDDQLRAVPGTEEVDMYGDPDEEIVVEVDPDRLTSLGLSVSEVSQGLGASDAKMSAGLLRSDDDLLMEVGGEFDSLQRIRNTPIHDDGQGRMLRVSDIATVRKGIRDPANTLALIEGKPAIALGILVRPDYRIDHWTEEVRETMRQFDESLPRGVKLTTVFAQNDYVQTRLSTLLGNLFLGASAVTFVVFLMMGWRSALLVGATLPLAALMVLTGMRLLDIPVHQMSVTGLIIALGLLIDNAIVVVDEVNGRLRRGDPAAAAVTRSVHHLALPLFGSTVTTALAFAPIALMPGPAGEFVSSIAVSVILAIFSSLFLALTVIPTLVAWFRRRDDRSLSPWTHSRWWRDGLTLTGLGSLYRATLDRIFARPWIGIAIGVVLPVAGFLQFPKLPEQFFPPSDRDQFQIELELGPTSSMQATLDAASKVRQIAIAHDEIDEVSWFLGESAPMFYYNVVPRRRNNSNYAQALVQLREGEEPLELIHALQAELDRSLPEGRVLVRQLEQGPPFDAPVELRIYGPDLDVLRALGDQVREVMSQVPEIVHTRSDLGDTVPKISLDVDEEEARMVDLRHAEIARQLSATLEGAVAGSILEATEELPVRVRVADDRRSRMESIGSLELMPEAGLSPAANDSMAANRTGDNRRRRGVPIAALADLTVIPHAATIPRYNNRRMNEIQAYTAAGVLPAKALARVETLLQQHGFRPPTGYTMEWGGEAAKRNDAVGNLLLNAGPLAVLMIATLVLSFHSFRIAGIIICVAVLSIGLGIGALWVFGYPIGFMAIIGTMGLVGVAINDTIVVLAAVRENPAAVGGRATAITDVVMRSTRHVVATSLTTMAGFIPLLIDGGGFWPPLAVSIAGGVGGATLLALYFAPSAYVLMMRTEQRQRPESRREQEARVAALIRA